MLDWQNVEAGEHRTLLQGRAGVVEAIIHIPVDFKASDVKAIALCCHPHPLFEGAMTNKVVHTLAKVMSKLGLMAVRFNFRGVGKSEGVHDNGVGETEDLIFLCQQFQALFPDAQLWLSGFSFGSYIAANAAAEVNAKQLVTVSPAVEHFNFDEITIPDCPWLVIMGEIDEIVSPNAVYNWVNNGSGNCQLVKFPDTGHFYHGKLVKLTDFLLAHFAPVTDVL